MGRTPVHLNLLLLRYRWSNPTPWKILGCRRVRGRQCHYARHPEVARTPRSLATKVLGSAAAFTQVLLSVTVKVRGLIVRDRQQTRRLIVAHRWAAEATRVLTAMLGYGPKVHLRVESDLSVSAGKIIEAICYTVSHHIVSLIAQITSHLPLREMTLLAWNIF